MTLETEVKELLKKQEYNHRIAEQRTEIENQMEQAIINGDFELCARLSAECDKLQYID